MLPWNIPLQSVVYKSFHELRRFVPIYCIFCFLVLVISGIIVRYLHSKVYQRKATKCFPTLPWITYLRVLMTADRKYANVSFLKIIFGACYLFPKEGIYRIKVGSIAKFAVLYNLEAVRFVLGSRTILTKGYEYDMFKPLVGDGLFVSNGTKRHTRRRQLTPSFHFTILNDFFHSFNKHANILVERIDELMKKEKSIDALRNISLCTLDTLLETTFGVSCNDVGAQNEEILEALHRGFDIVSKKCFFPWFWIDFIFSRTEEGKMLAKYEDFLHKFAKKVVEKRKWDMIRRQRANQSNDVNQLIYNTSGETKQRLAALDQLLNLHLKDSSVSFEEIVDEVLVFAAAGIETTSIAVSSTLYLLGLHQDIQRKVHQEMDAVFGDDISRIVTAEEIRSLKYLQCVLKETMRLYPPGGILARILDEDTIINGYEVEKGTSLIIPVFVVHRNPEVFSNPEEFVPDRFNKENCKNIPSFAYLPFSAGPRNCLGKRYAMYSAMTILSTVLRHFSVKSVEHRDKILLKFNVAMLPQNNIHLEFTRRQF